jgi:2-amino-4-hydroxy-6-hydroxymethyldihydropteridine diphosphokinase
MLHALIGLGANLGEPARVFANAIDKLASRGDVVSVSRLWRTRPLGPDQPDYCNAVVLIRWGGAPEGLLHASCDLEVAAGRNRSTEQRWGPRVLDLDLLMARDLVWRGPELDLPHPRFHQRAFALVPSAELVPGWIHPFVGRTIGELAEEVLREDPGALISSEPFPFALGSPNKG